MQTYPEMNETIKDLLKMNTESNVHQYAYQRIVELEKENKELRNKEDINTNGLIWLVEEMKDQKVIKEVCRYIGQLRIERDEKMKKQQVPNHSLF